MSVGVVTAIGFSVLYIGLAFLGNHFNVASALAKDADLNVGSYVLTMASRELFGTFGQAFLAVMVVITCLTTTVGLIVSVGESSKKHFPRFSYKSVCDCIYLNRIWSSNAWPSNDYHLLTTSIDDFISNYSGDCVLRISE